VPALHSNKQITIFLGRLISEHPSLVGFATQGSGAKASASFLVWDKIYQKLESEEDEEWFLRALGAVSKLPLIVSVTRTAKEDAYRLLGLAFLHLAVDSKNLRTRKSTLSTLSSLTATDPVGANGIVVTGLEAYLSRNTSSMHDAKRQRLMQVLSTCASYDQKAALHCKSAMLCRTLLLGHHPHIGEHGRQGWIELVQKSGLDPSAFVAEHASQLFHLVSPPTTKGQIAKPEVSLVRRVKASRSHLS
jgi:hypothetical protein